MARLMIAHSVFIMSTVRALITAKPRSLSTSTDTEDVHDRPNLTFNDLIRMALLSTPDNRATLGQIYAFIEDTYPYYKTSGACRHWKNSVRHTLCKHRQFRKVEGPTNAEGKPYKRGSAVWELSKPGLCSDSHQKPRQTRQKPCPVQPQARPSSLESTCSDNYPYPWQLDRNQSPVTDVLSTNMMGIPESVSPATEIFFKPWTASPEHLRLHSHLEAPRPEEVGSPLSETLADHPWHEAYWPYGQEYSTNRGVADPALTVGGAWSDSTHVSPVPVLANSALSVGHRSHPSAQSQYLYTDGLFLYSM